jgi:hypothetical protein
MGSYLWGVKGRETGSEGREQKRAIVMKRKKEFGDSGMGGTFVVELMRSHIHSFIFIHSSSTEPLTFAGHSMQHTQLCRENKSLFLCSHTTTQHRRLWAQKVLGFLPTSKQAVLQITPARGPLPQVSSDSVYLGVESDPTGWGLTPEGSSPQVQVPVLASACLTCASDSLAINPGFHNALRLVSLLQQLTSLKETCLLAYCRGITKDTDEEMQWVKLGRGEPLSRNLHVLN